MTSAKSSRFVEAADRLDKDLPVQFERVREQSLDLGRQISDEDQTPQSMPDASPAKWHLAHTTWFFEVMLLGPFLPGYEPFHPSFNYLFNSYYETVGNRHPRPIRGLLTRPSAAEVRQYRAHVNAAMAKLLEAAPKMAEADQIAAMVELGIAHEEQHQELLLTDILHLFAQNILHPAFQPYRPIRAAAAPSLSWFDYDGGIFEVGHDGDGFAFDNEGPRHDVLLHPFRLASRPVTVAEYQAFMADDGYQRAEFWMSDGWATVLENQWTAPLYWQEIDDSWCSVTLSGLQALNTQAPVTHISYYEADAYARWAGKRLPSEAEWEVVTQVTDGVDARTGNFCGSGLMRPRPAAASAGPDAPQQMFGDVWEWTASPYGPYPGYRPAAGAVGEYNGKFMSNQMVLKGGSCATPDDHVRASYRNFFYPHMRWQFMGLRLADDQ